MGNTRILTREFEYVAPETMPELLALLDRYGPAATIIAGGIDVVPQLKYEKISPDYLIDVTKIAELRTVRRDGALHIGAAVRLRDVKAYCRDNETYACLGDALGSIGQAQVVNMGTLGGNICTASPAADSALALLVLEARVRLIGSGGERVVPLDAFFRGPKMTGMEPGEVMAEIQVPAVVDHTGSAFRKIGRVAGDISKISCAVAVQSDGERCLSCRIGMGAVGPTPMRMPGVEQLLSGRAIDAGVMDEAADRIAADISPLTDVRSTEFYRRRVSRVLFKDTFDQAWKRVQR